MRIKFTDTAIAKLPPPPAGKKDCFRFAAQSSHLAIRIALESKIFYFQSRDEKGPFRIRIGKFPGVTTAEALRAVKVFDGDAARGVNLRAREAARKAKQQAAGEAFTLSQLLGDWATMPSARRASYTKTTVADLERAFRDLLNKPIDPAVNGKIEEQIEECLEALADRSAARRLAAQKLRSLCRWAVKRKKISADPTEKIDLGEKSKSRKVFLTGDEARVVWRAAGTMPTPNGPLVKLLEVSGLRLSEAAGALWREFSPDFSEWSIGGERMKEGEPHVVWLPPIVRQMLRDLPRFANCDLVFTRDGKRPVTGFSNLKRQLDKALSEITDRGFGESIARKFTFHDLRRTQATWLVRNGVDSFVADRLLAHTQLTKISAVASTYNIYDFEAERRAALEKWVDFLEGGEAAAIPSPSPQQALPAPDPTPLDGTILPSPAVSRAILEDYYREETPLLGTVVRYLPAKPEQRDGQTERLQRRIIDLLADPRVMRANLEILKATPTPKFKAEHPHDPNAEAIKLMAHCVAGGRSTERPSASRVRLRRSGITGRGESAMLRTVRRPSGWRRNARMNFTNRNTPRGTRLMRSDLRMRRRSVDSSSRMRCRWMAPSASNIAPETRCTKSIRRRLCCCC